MNWQLPLAITIAVVALVFCSVQWGKSLEKNKNLDADNKALLEYVKSQKEITDKYAPIFDTIKKATPSGIDPVIDYTLDQLPDPQHKNRPVRPSTEATKATK